MKLSTAFYYLGMIFPLSLVQIPIIGEIFPLLIILLSTLLVLNNTKISLLAIYVFSVMLVAAYFSSMILAPSVSGIFIFQQFLLLSSYLFLFSCSHVRENGFYLQKFGNGFLKAMPIITLFALCSFFFELGIGDISGFGAYLGHPVVHGFLGEPKQFAGFMIAALALEFFRSNSFSIYRINVIHLLFITALCLTFSVSGILNGIILLLIITFLKSSWTFKIIVALVTVVLGWMLISSVVADENSNLLLTKLSAPLLYLPMDGIVINFFVETPTYLFFGLGFDAINIIPSLSSRSGNVFEIYSRLMLFENLFEGQTAHFSSSILLIKILSTFGVLGLGIFVALQIRFSWVSCIGDRSKRTLYGFLPFVILVSYPIAMLLIVIANAYSFNSIGEKR